MDLMGQSLPMVKLVQVEKSLILKLGLTKLYSFLFVYFPKANAVVTKDAENFHCIMHMQKVFSLTFQLVVFLNQFFLSISGMLEQGTLTPPALVEEGKNTLFVK